VAPGVDAADAVLHGPAGDALRPVMLSTRDRSRVPVRAVVAELLVLLVVLLVLLP
jgi:hypothetical protein